MTSLTIVTLVHVAISLVGIATGFVVAYGFLANRRYERWTAIFLATTILTSLTGFAFPFAKVLPSHVLAVLSLAILAVTTFALYAKHLTSFWRSTYVVTALVAQYFNVFVLVVQAFQKVPVLKALAPTQTEPVFAITQLAVVAAFFALGYLAVRRFHPEIASVTTGGTNALAA